MPIHALPPGIDLLQLQSADPSRFPLLLESVAGGAQSRWDLLLCGDGTGLELGTDGAVRRLDGTAVAGGFLAALDRDFAAAGGRTAPAEAGGGETAGTPVAIPFRGGWGLFLAYELAAQIEPSLRLPAADGPLPVALALRCPAAIVRDRRDGRSFAVAEPGADALLATIVDAVANRHAAPAAGAFVPPVLEEDDPARFLDGVARIHDYLHAGDVFQVNPAPFAGSLRHRGATLLSTSPERLVSVHGGVAQTRPIAGTRPRLAGDDDAARIRDLVGNPKERAEHVMLIDLERNDLGRVCVPGSVRVDELMAVESYAHVHHIVSNVSGRLRPGTTPGEVIAAVFPGGTITGAPKVRCMAIIAELEGEGRGPYTGALGWLGVDGDLDLNILIRSAWLAGEVLELRAGAGIVVDSDAGRELDETRAKARGWLRALGAEA